MLVYQRVESRQNLLELASLEKYELPNYYAPQPKQKAMITIGDISLCYHKS